MISQAPVKPPKWPLKILRLFILSDYLEEIEGDMEEVFQDDLLQFSPEKAKRLYLYQTVKLLRPNILHRFLPHIQLNFITMLRHNILVAIRNFQRYKSSFLINLIGLSSGLACTLMIFLWVSDELSMNKFHEKDAQLYQYMEHVDQGTGMITRITSAGPTAKALTEEFPEVEHAITSTWAQNFTLTYENRDISGKGRFVGKDFFHLFTHPLLAGDKDQVLTKKNGMVISENMAISLFGTTENVVGKIIEWQKSESFEITGIFHNVPENSTLSFDMLIPFDKFWDDNEWVRNWFNTGPRTFLLLKEGTNVDEFNAKIYDYIRTKTENQATHRSPFIAKYSDRYLYGRYENGSQAGGRISYVKLFSLIACIVLLIACINFMNLSTARASRRIKEVAIKKAVGAYRSSLIGQYLGESLLMAFLSLLVAIIAVWLLLPHFSLLTGKELALTFDTKLVFWLLSIVLITGLVAGSYPAFYLSKFSPISMFRTKMKGSMGESWARKGLVVFQFSISIVLIVSVIVVYKQIEYTQTKNLGYDKDNVLIINRDGALRDNDKFETFMQEASNLGGISAVAASGHDMTGHNGGTYGIEWPGKDPEDRTEFERVEVTEGMIELMEIEVKEGRSFSKEFRSDTSKIIFNEAGIAFMGLTDPIGKSIKLWGEDKEIVGVLEDFHFNSLHEEVKPLFMYLSRGRTDYALAKISAGREKEALTNLEEFYAQFNPGFDIRYRFLDSDYEAMYESEQRVSTLSSYFGAVAILISCLGLFGLAAFTAERRLKEIGIRKILGSSSLGIIFLLSFDLTKLVFVALFIGMPISYFIADTWLQSFAFRISLEIWFFLGAGVLSLAIAWITVSFQTFKAANINPAQCLRNE